MANAIGTNQVRKLVVNTKPFGKRWGKTVQDFVTKEAAKQARALLKAGTHTTEDDVEVRIPVFLHLTFARKSRGIDGDASTVQCACILKSSSDGSSVCICQGPDAASCDCPPIYLPSV